jgi:hypothetical protein
LEVRDRKLENASKNFIGKPESKKPLGKIKHRRIIIIIIIIIIIKAILNKYRTKIWTGFICLSI